MLLPLTTEGIGGLPGIDLSWLISQLASYMMASLRIGAFMISAPLLGARWLPLQARIIMAFMLSGIVFHHAAPLSAEDIASASGVIMMAMEIAIGLAGGLVLTIWFSAVLLAGEKIASTAGLGYAAQMDPISGGQTPVVSQTLYLFLMVIFLSVDGHLLAIHTMLESYRILPIGNLPNPGAMLSAGIDAAGAMFFAATIIMTPVAIILLMVNVSIGIITRSAPQLNLFSFGFPITLLVVFIILYFSVGTIAESMRDLVDEAINSLQQMIGEMANG